MNPHHIEFQIVADNHGNTVHLGERDCSIQRRNQKVIEECPSPLLTPALRKKMGQAAVKLAQSVGYVNAGTMEFLVDQQRQLLLHRDEHPHPGGTHHHRGSLRMRSGEGTDSRSRRANSCRRTSPGHCRVPTPSSAGSMRRIRRAISSPRPGGSISTTRRAGAVCGSIRTLILATSFRPNYDSMIAKLIAVGATRESAIARMRRALGEYLITGIKTTIPFHNAIMRNADFRNGHYDTGFVDRVMNSETFELRTLVRPVAPIERERSE